MNRRNLLKILPGFLTGTIAAGMTTTPKVSPSNPMPIAIWCKRVLTDKEIIKSTYDNRHLKVASWFVTLNKDTSAENRSYGTYLESRVRFIHNEPDFVTVTITSDGNRGRCYWVNKNGSIHDCIHGQLWNPNRRRYES